MIQLQATKVYNIVQKAFSEHFAVLSAQGSSRSGKTYNIIIFIVLLALKTKTTVSICRKTLPSLKRSVLKDFETVLSSTKQPYKVNRSELVYTLSNGSRIEFFSVDEEQKIKGSKREVLFVNEANEITFSEWQQLNMRTTLFSIIDYNPSFTDEHWICSLNRQPSTLHFITTYKDNPFLEQRVITEIESLKDKNPTLWKIYGEGLQAVPEGLIYTNFEIVEDFPEYAKKVCIALDYGFTNDPTAIVLCGVYEDKLFIKEIEYSAGLLTNEIINILRPYKSYTLISEIDPRLIAELKRSGFHVVQVKKNNVMVGVQKLQQLKLCPTKHSPNVIKELRNYTYLEKDGKFLNRPIDAYNHSLDAVRYYALMVLFAKEPLPRQTLMVKDKERY